MFMEKDDQRARRRNRRRAWLIKKVEENPGGENTPEEVHPATFLEELKEAQKQSTEAIEILKRILELRRKLDDLSYAPCPETGLYAGREGIKNCGRLHATERNADTDEITNEFTDNGDPLGGGIVLGYNFRPWHDSIVVGPFGSFDWLDQTINHTFPSGSFLGTRSNWIATVGGKAGVATTSDVFLYCLAGSVLVEHRAQRQIRDALIAHHHGARLHTRRRRRVLAEQASNFRSAGFRLPAIPAQLVV